MENEWKWPKWWNTVQAHVVALILYWFQIVLPLAGMFFQNCDLVWPWDYWDVPSASPTPTAPCRGRVWLCHWWAAFRFVGASSRGENGIVSPSVFILWRLLPPEVNTKNPQKWHYPIYFWVLKILKKVGYIYNYIYIYIIIYKYIYIIIIYISINVATHFSQPFPKPHFLLARRGSHLPRGLEQRPWGLWQIPCLRQSDVSVICLQAILKMNRTYKYLNPRFGVRYGSGNGLMEDFILKNLHQICQTGSVSG